RAALASEAGRSPAVPELFTLRTSLRRALSRQRQGGAKRRRGGLLEQQRSNGRRPRCQRTERQLHVAAGRRTGGAPERRNRRDTCARDGKSHSFGAEVRQLLKMLARGRSQIWYSRPAADDREGREY